MVRGAHHQLSVCQAEQFLPKSACEDLVPIGDDALRKAVQLVDVVEEELRHLGCCKWMLQWDEMFVLRQLVDHHQDDVVAVGLGQPFHEIQTQCMPGGW
jgi:hypothetical protein